ncbi:hypothetical protein GBF38_008671 [Nibea albiflora]|uniref:Uncharacterized protein n=1 Tax=Nibea albiflora TaxID=240163 RepID=A0ACB7EQV0_NIBAL|nr:hypothetical protein GBF38_008671 [Nibea albiflora]
MEENLQHDSSPQSDPGSSASSVLKMVQWGRTPTANVETWDRAPAQPENKPCLRSALLSLQGVLGYRHEFTGLTIVAAPAVNFYVRSKPLYGGNTTYFASGRGPDRAISRSGSGPESANP